MVMYYIVNIPKLEIFKLLTSIMTCSPLCSIEQVNCPFYFKIGACRHADRCSRIHHRPAFSPTILIKHIFRHPIREAELKALSDGLDKDQVEWDRDKATEDFLQFFE